MACGDQPDASNGLTCCCSTVHVYHFRREVTMLTGYVDLASWHRWKWFEATNHNLHLPYFVPSRVRMRLGKNYSRMIDCQDVSFSNCNILIHSKLVSFRPRIHHHSRLVSCRTLIHHYSKLVSCRSILHRHSRLISRTVPLRHHSRLVSCRALLPQQAGVLKDFHTSPQQAGVSRGFHTPLQHMSV